MSRLSGSCHHRRHHRHPGNSLPRPQHHQHPQPHQGTPQPYRMCLKHPPCLEARAPATAHQHRYSPLCLLKPPLPLNLDPRHTQRPKLWKPHQSRFLPLVSLRILPPEDLLPEWHRPAHPCLLPRPFPPPDPLLPSLTPTALDTNRPRLVSSTRTLRLSCRLSPTLALSESPALTS